MLGLLLLALGLTPALPADPGPFLKTSGIYVRNDSGAGDIVPLRGVNLGSWLLMEGWMCPMDSSSLPDQHAVVQTLNNRFGVLTQESLLKTYQETWLTTNDLDRIQALGLNCVRLPFWWGNVQRADGSWRTDAFEKVDWLVTNAWQRGLYTIIDFHGLPGGQSASDSTAQAGLNAYWTNATYKYETSLIWSNVAAHFQGNPAVAAYDLINEPFGAPNQAALWTAYNNLYQTVRAADPDHIIIVEGTWSGSGLNWEWNVLPAPTHYGWTNIIYSMHAYAGDTSASGEQAETDKQVADYQNHLSWNVPAFIGEFNNHGTAAAWQYAIPLYNQNHIGWANWAYKATAGGVGNAWGIYDPTGTWPPVPNIQTDAATTISNKWARWSTAGAFGLTTFLQQALGAPRAVPEAYTNNGPMNVSANAGVLANDTDINLGQPGIALAAVLVAGPANGQLALATNGGFTYTPNPGFNGTDTFRYRVFDGYQDSANVATVSLVVVSNTTAGPVAQLRWTTQPGAATNGLTFGQPPVLQTADATGTPSTYGLPGSLVVSVALTAGAGQLTGTTNVDLGTAAGNGTATLTDLQIDTAGPGFQLTATAPPPAPVSLLGNGDFNAPATTAAPTGWTEWSYGAGYANHELITPATAVRGNYDGSYQMTAGATDTTSGGGVYQIVPAHAGWQYHLAVDSGVQNWWWPAGEMRLFFFDSNSAGLATNIQSVTGGISGYDIGKPCQPYALDATAPAGTTQAKVEFAGFGGGSVWFDNAVLTETANQPALAPATTETFAVYANLLGNPTNVVAGITALGAGVFALHFRGSTGGAYYVQFAPSLAPPINWQPLAGSTNTVTNADGSWFCTITNAGPQAFYRAVALGP